NGSPLAVVGHDKAGRGTSHWDFGYKTDFLPAGQGDPSVAPNDLKHKFRLDYYLSKIQQTESLRYRPIFIYLEKKPYDNGDPFGGVQWDGGDPKWDDPKMFYPVLEQVLGRVFGDNVFGPRALHYNGNQYPIMQDLAGKVIPIIEYHTL